MKHLLFLSVLLLFPFGAHAQNQGQAQAQPEPEKIIHPSSLPAKDSMDFMGDDGVMSPEEMEQEADYVHQLCNADPYKRMYFDCDCLSGAFLVKREARGPLVPQFQIMDELTTKATAVCANTPSVAGETYNYCTRFVENYRVLQTDGEQYCSCVANKVANSFTKKPLLSPDYVTMLTTDAMGFCDDPNNRPKNQSAEKPSAGPLVKSVN